MTKPNRVCIPYKYARLFAQLSSRYKVAYIEPSWDDPNINSNHAPPMSCPSLPISLPAARLPAWGSLIVEGYFVYTLAVHEYLPSMTKSTRFRTRVHQGTIHPTEDTRAQSFLGIAFLVYQVLSSTYV